MALKDMKSLYDRHKRGELGQSIGRPDGQGPKPSAGDYFSEEGLSDSPFDSVRGPKSDQMVKLLTKSTQGQFSTYPPSPSKSTYQDLDGTFSTLIDPALGQFGGPYTHPENGGTF